MKLGHSLLASIFVAAGCLSNVAHAVDYNFDVLYSGNGVATLNTGSDNPDGLTLWDGDTFDWTITAQGTDTWTVVTGGDFFPLMAFKVDEPGDRIGDFTLTLSNGGASVFSANETNTDNEQIHLGTNGINLDTGLVFDQMHLQFSLTYAIEYFGSAEVPPENPQQIGSTLQGLLPIFGAPEQNESLPGVIVYAPVPEAQTWVMLLAGLGLVGAAVRRRRA